MSKAPLTAPRSEAFTSKQGRPSGSGECLVKEASLMVKKKRKSGLRCLWRSGQNFLEHLPLRDSEGQEEELGVVENTAHHLLFPTYREAGSKIRIKQ